MAHFVGSTSIILGNGAARLIREYWSTGTPRDLARDLSSTADGARRRAHRDDARVAMGLVDRWASRAREEREARERSARERARFPPAPAARRLHADRGSPGGSGGRVLHRLLFRRARAEEAGSAAGADAGASAGASASASDGAPSPAPPSAPPAASAGAGAGAGPPKPKTYKKVEMPTPEQIVMDDLMNNCLVKSVLATVMGGVLGAAMGIFFGAFEGPVPGEEKLSVTQSLKNAARSTASKSWSYAKGFAAFGALYSGSECVVEQYRASHDIYNSAYAGCFTGGVMARSGGPQGMAMGCATMGALSVCMDKFMDMH